MKDSKLIEVIQRILDRVRVTRSAGYSIENESEFYSVFLLRIVEHREMHAEHTKACVSCMI